VTSLALYTAIYPGVERYLADWFASVRRQTDRDFRLWVGLDEVSVEAARAAMGGDPDAVWVPGRTGDSPATIRQRALARIVERHDAVVLVDSDDVMHATRVATARAMLRTNDLVGCALRLVDEWGANMDLAFTLPPDLAPESVFPRTNAFGLSNSAYRVEVLRRCLPIPAAAALVDWFLSTRAWLFGARLWFGTRAEMDYRQHGANMARVRAPFPEQQVLEDVQRVRLHFRLVRASRLQGAIPERLAELEHAAADIESFYKRVVLRPELLTRYVDALNKLGTTTSLWWAWVANPAVRHLWAAAEGAA